MLLKFRIIFRRTRFLRHVRIRSKAGVISRRKNKSIMQVINVDFVRFSERIEIELIFIENREFSAFLKVKLSNQLPPSLAWNYSFRINQIQAHVTTTFNLDLLGRRIFFKYFYSNEFHSIFLTRLFHVLCDEKRRNVSCRINSTKANPATADGRCYNFKQTSKYLLARFTIHAAFKTTICSRRSIRNEFITEPESTG